MFDRILVAIDGSEISRQALQAALTLAKERRSTLQIVHVVDTVSLNPEDSELFSTSKYKEHVRAQGRAILEQALHATQSYGQVETKLLEIETLGFHVADLIAAEAESWQADLVVVGTHGRRGVRRLFLGSVAEGVSRISSKPVLLIRGK